MGDAIGLINDWGNAYLAMIALNKLYHDIQIKQSQIDYGDSQQFYVLYGTAPVRYLGLTKGEDVLVSPDVRSYLITIDGTNGLPIVDPYESIVRDALKHMLDQRTINGCIKMH